MRPINGLRVYEALPSTIYNGFVMAQVFRNYANTTMSKDWQSKLLSKGIYSILGKYFLSEAS